MTSPEDLRRLLRWSPYDNCSAPSILDFPYVGMPTGILGVLLPILVLIYSYMCLAVLCSRFFLPALSTLSFNLSSEAAKCTLMTVAASIPELAISIVGTFLTEEDVGVSAIVGSAVFNTLLIPALCALLTPKKEGNTVGAWALTRDSLMYGLSLLCLAIVLRGDVIMWYEAAVMIIMYFLYLGGMLMDKVLKRRTASFYYKIKKDIFERSPLIRMGGKTFYGGEPEFFSSCDEAVDIDEGPDPSGTIRPWYKKTICCIIWPTTQTMRYSIPGGNPWIAIVVCCLWIGVITYITSWMITIISYKFGLPDSLMALTVLGIGIGIPELFISLNVAEKGNGTLALTNALGSNIINILLCLGIPWIVKMAVSKSHSILFTNDGLSYSCLLMFFILAILYISMAINKFVLDKKVGWLLLVLYIIFFVLSALIELNVFFQANLPLCDISAYFSENK